MGITTTNLNVDDIVAALRREAGELDIEPILLSLAEGFELGKKRFEKVKRENR